MSLENLKKLSGLFNVELQETKLQIMDKKESLMEKFTIEKLNVEKELNQIEESLEFFENENEILVKALTLKEKDFANTRELFEYDKKNLQIFTKEKIELVNASRAEIENFLEAKKDAFEKLEKEKDKLTQELEEKIRSVEEQIGVYQENLGMFIELIDRNRFGVELKLNERTGKFFLEIGITNEGDFRIFSIIPKVEFQQELDELNSGKRIAVFLYKIREKFLSL